jgi:hypothetical protein
MSRFSNIIIVLSVLLTLASCDSPDSAEQNAAAPRDSTQKDQIKRLADEILQALATRNYHLLEPTGDLIDAPANLTGPQIAARLLGPHAYTMLLVRWNAQTIEVTFDQDDSFAAAKVAVEYRYRANSRIQTDIFTFRFHYLSNLRQWRLIIQ